MATQLFIRDTAETGVSIGSFDERKLATTRGPGLVSANVATTASGNHLSIDSATGAMIWLYRVNAVTIAGTITPHIYGLENAMTTNAGLAVVISRYDSAGTFVSDVVAQANAAHAKGVELGLAAADQSWTITPTSTAFSDGDWLAVIVHADAVGTMAAGTVTINYDRPVADIADTYVSFTETITEYGGAAAQPPYTSPYPQLLVQ